MCVQPVCVLFSGKYLDAARDRNQGKVDFWCALQAAAGVASFLIAWCGLWCLESSAASQTARLKATFFHSLLDQDQSYKASYGPGELAQILEDEAQSFKNAAGAKSGQIAFLSSQFIAGYVVALSVHWKLALILSGMIPVLLGGGAFTLWSVSSVNARTKINYTEATNILEETFSSIQIVASYCLEQWFIDK